MDKDYFVLMTDLEVALASQDIVDLLEEIEERLQSVDVGKMKRMCEWANAEGELDKESAAEFLVEGNQRLLALLEQFKEIRAYQVAMADGIGRAIEELND